MDDLALAYLNEQAEARLRDALSGDPVAFTRYLARIRQAADGFFEKRSPKGNWYRYLPGGFPYGAREVDALRARGYRVTEKNVQVGYP